MRCDATSINSLFYSIDSREVEDFTGMVRRALRVHGVTVEREEERRRALGGSSNKCQGVRDLRDGIIRTPRDPHRTLDDDPVRMMRAVRFGARFGFSYADGLLDAMLSPASHVRL